MKVSAFSACLDPTIIDYPKVGKNEQHKISRTGSRACLVKVIRSALQGLDSQATGEG